MATKKASNKGVAKSNKPKTMKNNTLEKTVNDMLAPCASCDIKNRELECERESDKDILAAVASRYTDKGESNTVSTTETAVIADEDVVEEVLIVGDALDAASNSNKERKLSTTFTLDGVRYSCKVELEGFTDIESEGIWIEKTCSDFMFFCGNECGVFIPDICLPDIRLKDRTLKAVDKLLSGLIKNTSGKVSLYDVCVGKDRSVTVYKPFDTALGEAYTLPKQVIVYVDRL